MWSDSPGRLQVTLASAPRLALDRQVELELGRQLLLAVQPVREVNPPDPAVGVDLDSSAVEV